MGFKNRRVVTGLNSEGKSCVIFDSPVDQLPGGNAIPAVVWRTECFPVSNAGSDETAKHFESSMFGDSSLVLLFTPPPSSEPPAWHSTNTIDYVVVLSGKISFGLETGTVELNAGDLIVDRGIVHSWCSVGDEPALMLAVMIQADPVGAGGDLGSNFDQYLKN